MAGKFKHTIAEMQNVARSRNGECLSSEYLGLRVKLKFRCELGHEFYMCPDRVLEGRWCRRCANIQRVAYKKGTIEQFQKIAESRGGKCLSKNYVNSEVKLKFQCKIGHTWRATPHHIKNGSWCPYCAGSVSEERCRFIFEFLFEDKFPKDRKALEGLELDGYNDKLKLAFEYDGIQHYMLKPIFHKNRECFEKTVFYDKMKLEKCNKKGINLIIIPYTVPSDKLLDFIVRQLRKLGYKIDPIKIKSFSFDIFVTGKAKRLMEIKEIAKSKGGDCLSSSYIDKKTKMKFICKEGHIWEATPDSVKNGNRWCPICANKIRAEKLRKPRIAVNT